MMLHQVINDVNHYMNLLLNLLEHLFEQLVNLYNLRDLYQIYVELSKDFQGYYSIFGFNTNFINN
jgi:hypothetical protein